MGYIYKITNNINNKVYIGQTKNSVNRRWTEHKRDSKKNNNDFVLYRAMRKYGFDNFIVETIEFDVPLDKLNEREVYWIKFYDSFNSEKGYNLTSGGGQNTKISDSTKEKHRQNALMGITGHKHLPTEEVYNKEVREKISKGNKGKKMSEESKRKLSESLKGKKCSQKSINLLIERNKNRVWTEEQRKKISDSMKRHLSDKNNHNFYHKYGEESPYHVCVLQYDYNRNFVKKFNSKKEVLEYLELKGHNGLNKAIKNKTLYKGYYWSIEGVETNEIASYEEKKVV